MPSGSARSIAVILAAAGESAIARRALTNRHPFTKLAAQERSALQAEMERIVEMLRASDTRVRWPRWRALIDIIAA